MNRPLRPVPDPPTPDPSRPDPVVPVATPDGTGAVLVIDCDDCRFVGTSRCADCVVTHVLDLEPARPLVLVGDELDAVRRLSEAGLVPPTRFEARGPRAGPVERAAGVWLAVRSATMDACPPPVPAPPSS